MCPRRESSEVFAWLLETTQRRERARMNHSSSHPLRQRAPSLSVSARAPCRMLNCRWWWRKGSSAEFHLSFYHSCRTIYNIVSLRRDLSRGDGERGQYGRGRTGGTARPRSPCSGGSGFHFSTTGLWTAHQAQQWSACRRKWGWTRAGD